jgi:hypothetical protein
MESVAHNILRRGWIGDATIAGMLPRNAAEIRVIEDGSTYPVLLTKQGMGVDVQGPQNVRFQVVINDPGSRVQGGGHTSPRTVTFVEVDRADVDPAVLDGAISRADLRGERRAPIELMRPLLPGLRDLRILQPEVRELRTDIGEDLRK